MLGYTQGGHMTPLEWCEVIRNLAKHTIDNPTRVFANMKELLKISDELEAEIKDREEL
jgi:hypothetical protein